MRLDDYQWSRNPRGLHVTPNYVKPNFDRYRSLHMGWIKLIVSGTEYLSDIATLVGSGITPIIRFYFERPGARFADDALMRNTTTYIGAGARWFEFYNEPNLPIEWPEANKPDYANNDGVIAPLMANWLDWAEKVTRLGGYPAFPALAESREGPEAVIPWLNAMLEHLARNYYDRFRAVANSGLWVATHPYYYNHFYQEAGAPTAARPPEAQNANEGGWHFEYPYDPIAQANDPGRGVLQGTPREPNGDPVGLTGMGSAFMQRFRELFGGNMIPVVGTEGGITPIPGPSDGASQPDNRYPPVTYRSHAEGTLAAFNYLASGQAPPWMFGLCLWKEDDYFGDGNRPAAPAVQRLADAPPLFKAVNRIEAMAPGKGPGPLGAPVPGPGPIHGMPDLHWLIMAPGTDPTVIMEAGRDYWELYRPAILTALDLIAQVPPTLSLAVTLVAPPAQADALKARIKALGPNIYIDLIPAETAAQLQAVFADRIRNDAPYG